MCSIYDLRPAPSGLPPLQPEYLLLQVYTCSLLIISSSFRLAELLCYSEASVVSFHVSPRVSPFFGSSILLLIFFLPSPFFRYMILFSFIHFVSICSSRILYVYLTESDCQKGQANGGRTGESGCVDVCKYFFFALYEFRL